MTAFDEDWDDEDDDEDWPDEEPGPRRAVVFGATAELADVVHLPERRRRTGRG